jgi:hypothetical protein
MLARNDEEDVGDLELDLFFNLSGHFLGGDSKLCADFWPSQRFDVEQNKQPPHGEA